MNDSEFLEEVSPATSKKDEYIEAGKIVGIFLALYSMIVMGLVYLLKSLT